MMQNTATISQLSIVPESDQAPVKPLLSAEEKTFLDLVAGIFVKDLLKQAAQNLQSTEE